ncbi:MAG TPA: transposase [Terriglobia bacterium]|jgi:hypothetical protein|nr:transposase [Terriglobia bacterium]
MKAATARGEMENRIKEQLMLFADHTSTALLPSHQIRLYVSSIAYTLRVALRRLGLKARTRHQRKRQRFAWNCRKLMHGSASRSGARGCHWPAAILMVFTHACALLCASLLPVG